MPDSPSVDGSLASKAHNRACQALWRPAMTVYRTTFCLALLTACTAIAGTGQIGSFNGLPMQPTTATGSLRTLTNLGDWSNPVCRTDDYLPMNLADILQGVDEDSACEDGTNSALAYAATSLNATEAGLSMKLGGGGQASAGTSSNMSLHESDAVIDYYVPITTRVRLDWSLDANGAAEGTIRMSPMSKAQSPVIDVVVAAVDEPIRINGSSILRISRGDWRVEAATAHDANTNESGLDSGSSTVYFNITTLADGDADGNGVVDVNDILAIISNWGGCGGPLECPSDLNNDTLINVQDLLLVLSGMNG